MCKISFVIPVYNTEDYLEKCIESILSQSYSDYEIILVNDGSRDSSGEICNRYSLNYTFIHTIHKENAGLAAARNTGINHAMGEFIIFVDSDDYIGNEVLGEAVKALEENPNVDLVFLESVKVFENGKTYIFNKNCSKEQIFGKARRQVLEHLACLPKFPGTAWGKVVRRQFILEKSQYFIEGLLQEDLDWSIRLFIHAENFNYSPVIFYYYREERKGSITKTLGEINLIALLEIIKNWCQVSNNHTYKKEIEAFLAYEYMIALLLFSYIHCTDTDGKIMRDLEDYRWLLKRSKITKVKVTDVLVTILGIKRTGNLLELVLKLRKFWQNK